MPKKIRYSLGQITRKPKHMYYLKGGDVYEMAIGAPKGSGKKIKSVTGRTAGSLAWVDSDGFVFEVRR